MLGMILLMFFVFVVVVIFGAVVAFAMFHHGNDNYLGPY